MTIFYGKLTGSGTLVGAGFTVGINISETVTINLSITGNTFSGTEQDVVTATDTVFVPGVNPVTASSTGDSGPFHISGTLNQPVTETTTVAGQTITSTSLFSINQIQISANDAINVAGLSGNIPITGTLLPPVISFSSGALSVAENLQNQHATYTLTRSFIPPGDTGSSVLVNTKDGSAVAGVNYIALINYPIVFGPGQTSQTFFVPILDDDSSGDDNYLTPINLNFSLVLSNPTNAAIGFGTANTTIVENDDTAQLPANFPPLPANANALVIPAGTNNFQTPNAANGQTQYTMAGSNKSITIAAGAGNQVIYDEPLSGGGANTVIGGSGTDDFIAGSGNNNYIGGTGITIVDYSFAPSATTINLATGIVVNGFGGTDHFSNIHNVVGSANSDTVIDGSGSSSFNGSSGGSDTAVFHGPRSEYSVATLLGSDSLTHIKVTDQGSAGDGPLDLVNVQQLQFADQLVKLQAVASIKATNLGVLRIADADADALAVAASINSGQSTVAAYVSQLISQAQTTTVPALITYDFFYGKTPAAAGLDYLANFDVQLAKSGFSLINVWVNLGASFAANGLFGPSYNSMARDQFVDTVYTLIFGSAPSAAAHSTLTNSMNFYAAFTGSELGARGAVAGIMLYLTDQNPNSNYAQSATHFLQDAAVEAPAYQVSLVGTYLSSSTPHH